MKHCKWLEPVGSDFHRTCNAAAYMVVMSDFNEADHPRQKTGRFAEKQQNAPEVGLAGSDVGRALAGTKDLAGANLRNADLYRANLVNADLTGASLRWADLTGANLHNADLSRADLSRANLAGANLAGANLRGANLAVADLRGANLTGANLRWANLRRAFADVVTVWPDGFDPAGRGVIEEASDE